MTVDDAIKYLESVKKGGTKSVVIAWWTADMFGLKDDEEWEVASSYVESKMDWSSTHENINMMLESCDMK